MDQNEHARYERARARHIMWALDGLHHAYANPDADRRAFDRWSTTGMAKAFGFPEDLFEGLTPAENMAEAHAQPERPLTVGEALADVNEGGR